MADVIREYLVSLGFQVRNQQLQQFNDALRTAGFQVTKLTSGMTREFAVAGSAVVGALASVAAGTVALMDHTAQADLGYQLFARRMFMSTDAAKQLKIATDALGYSLEDIVWGPRELQERYHQLVQDQKEMMRGLGGKDFSAQMRQIRDIRFEFTRMGVELQYLTMQLTKTLSKALFGDENALLGKLREFNTWMIRNIPYIAGQITTHLAPALRDIYAIGQDIAELFKGVSSFFISFTGIVANMDQLKDGKVTVDNLAAAFERWVRAARNIADTIKEIFGYLSPPAGSGSVFEEPAWLRRMFPELYPKNKEKNGFSWPQLKPMAGDAKGAAAAAAKQYSVDPALFMALVEHESGWNPQARNPQSGAMGFSQIMPSNRNMYGKNAAVPRENLEIGARYLSELLSKHRGDVRGALKEYGGFVTKDPAAYQADIIRRSRRYRGFKPEGANVSGRTEIGDIHVHVVHPGATAEEIASAVRKSVREEISNQTQRNLVQLDGTYA